jgi:hypothetical protein
MINTSQGVSHRSITEKILIVLIFLGTICFLFLSITSDIAEKKDKTVRVVENEKYKDTYTKNDLRENSTILARYFSERGFYPDSFQSSGMYFRLYDEYDREIYYKVSANKRSYDMRGLGEDGVYGTADDVILP